MQLFTDNYNGIVNLSMDTLFSVSKICKIYTFKCFNYVFTITNFSFLLGSQ